jgi:hypothetical protein
MAKHMRDFTEEPVKFHALPADYGGAIEISMEITNEGEELLRFSVGRFSKESAKQLKDALERALK